jgi:hypothetical protein
MQKYDDDDNKPVWPTWAIDNDNDDNKPIRPTRAIDDDDENKPVWPTWDKGVLSVVRDVETYNVLSVLYILVVSSYWDRRDIIVAILDRERLLADLYNP